MLSAARQLRKRGVLGLNQRNADFIAKYNKRRFFPLVDDKLTSKALAEKAAIAVPKLYAVISSQHQVSEINSILSAFDDFVIKPAKGSGGEGILVVTGRGKDNYRKANGEIVDHEELKYYLSRVLSGVYSLGGNPDRAIVEYRVTFDPIFEKVSYLGVPDIRIIVFLGVPIMAMVRLPTRRSDGKANLHQGAIGVGIELKTGKTLSAVCGNKIVEEHPDTGASVVGIQIPNWNNLLEIASRTSELSGLGFQGVDLVLDKNLGPLLLELNARPGLQIQLANQAGLLNRLRVVESNRDRLETIHEKVAFAKENFGK